MSWRGFGYIFLGLNIFFAGANAVVVILSGHPANAAAAVLHAVVAGVVWSSLQ